MKMDLKKQKEKLILEIKKDYSIYLSNSYTKISKLFGICKKINPKYKVKHLAVDLDMHEQGIYKILTFKYATDATKKLIKEDKISYAKVLLLFNRYGPDIEDEKAQEVAIKMVIDNKMTRLEIEKYFTQEKKKNVDVKKEREFNNNWNIARDIGTYCVKLQRVLLSVKNVPDSKKEEVIKSLNLTKEKIDIALKVLE